MLANSFSNFNRHRMNQYSELLNYFKKYGDTSSYIKTTLKCEPSKLLEDKRVIFPILHVGVDSGDVQNGIGFDIELTCLDDRDLSNELVEDVFWSNDNEIDNHNSTLALLVSLWEKISNDFANTGISTESTPTFEKITFAESKIADGWLMTFKIEMPNNQIDLCSL